METQSNIRQKDSGNTEQHKTERQWKQTTEGRKTVKHRTTQDRKTVETQSNIRQKDSGNKQQKAERQ